MCNKLIIIFSCKICNKEFKYKSDLDIHLKRKISCNRILKCNKCDKKFKLKSDSQRYLNKKFDCSNKSINNELVELQNQVKELQQQLITISNSNNTLNSHNQTNSHNNNHTNSHNNIIINNFGNEDISHITKELLETEILNILNRETNLGNKKVLEYKNIKYSPIDIKLIDIHILLMKLIYFSKLENNTIKKDDDKYYVNNNNWNEISLSDLNLRVLNKQQEVLICLKSSELISERKFMKLLENYFGYQEDNLKIKTGQIEFILPKRKFLIIRDLIDYELENLNLVLSHN